MNECRSGSSDAFEGNWRIAEINGQPVSGMGAVRFRHGEVSGRAVCNGYHGTYVATEASFKVSDVARTTKACGEGKDALEARYLRALVRAVSYKVNNGEVLLFDEHQEVVLRLAK